MASLHRWTGSFACPLLRRTSLTNPGGKGREHVTKRRIQSDSRHRGRKFTVPLDSHFEQHQAADMIAGPAPAEARVR